MRKKLAVLATALVLAGCASKEDQTPVQEPVNEKKEVVKEEATLYSPFTGEEIKEKHKKYFSVMIENSPDARPQTGLTVADVVYEIKTEGNISRYLAFFYDEVPKVVGPVRSSRHYFITLAEEMNSPYIHFGASTYAYEYLRSNQIQIPHIDGITEGQYFFRDKARVAPHNAYLKTDTLNTYEKMEPKNEHFTFGENALENGKIAKVISYRYNDFTDIKYKYDEKEKMYLRYQEEEPHIDRETKEQIKVKNILFQYTDHESINNDKKGRIDVNLIGEGKGLYISEGKTIGVTWKKGNADTSTIYYDEEGNILTVNRGNTWIQVVGTNEVIGIN